LNPLDYIFKLPLNPKFPRQLFMVTDGDATDSHVSVLNLVKNSSGLVRVFTLGIGTGSNRDLLLEMARKGHGEVVAMVI
jgi:hypothetical protein